MIGNVDLRNKQDKEIDRLKKVLELTKGVNTVALNLCEATMEYRRMHDVHGDGSLEAGRAWDRLKREETNFLAAMTGLQRAEQ